jgi:hypothetical protein
MSWNRDRQTVGCLLLIAAFVIIAIVVGRLLEGR